jgi:autoinducer 2-degrading protein
MFIILVHVHVKSGCEEAFKAATLENARSSVTTEPGVARFDFLQQQDDAGRFTLVEVYRAAEDHAKHRESAHYARWRDAVADMMASPRTAVKYSNLFPGDGRGWDCAL